MIMDVIRIEFDNTTLLAGSAEVQAGLEQDHDASSTINLRLAAVRRLADEAADSRLLGPDLAAGIRRVKSAKKHGTRVGNWLTAEQGQALLSTLDRTPLRGKRDDAMVAVLLGCDGDEPSWLLPKSQTDSNAKNTGYSPA